MRPRHRFNYDRRGERGAAVRWPGPLEKDFRKEILKLAGWLGWKRAAIRPVRVQRANGQTHHETPMEADGCGWPDLFLVKGKVALALELKVGRNKPKPEQEAWIAALANVPGIVAAVVTPADWPWIEAHLRGDRP